MTAATDLPAYDPLQAAFHETFRPELYAAIDRLPVPADGHVLDAPCGNGFYARRLAERLGPGGRLTLIDGNRAYLAEARRAVARRAAVRRADVYELPFADGAFDFVWCAQSLISLADTGRALAELARVTKPGGRIAVLEADEFHHVLLPWPVELELAVQRAVHTASRRRYGSGSRLAPARHLRRALAEAGWAAPRKHTFAADRHPPFRPWEAEFLTRHLEFLAGLVRDDLAPADRAAFDRLTDPASPTAFLCRPDAELTCLNTLHLARRGG